MVAVNSRLTPINKQPYTYMSFQIQAFHGTNSELVANIKQSNFRKSEKKNEWLGFGVYFFVEGITEPIANAVEWATNQSYHSEGYRYDSLSVLESTVVCDKNAVLNVTENEGLKVFNELRDVLNEKHKKSFKNTSRDLSQDNRVIWNAMSEYLSLDAIVHNLYIKDCFQRRKKVNSNVPNTTVLCVKDPKFIRLDSITEIVKKEIIK